LGVSISPFLIVNVNDDGWRIRQLEIVSHVRVKMYGIITGKSLMVWYGHIQVSCRQLFDSAPRIGVIPRIYDFTTNQHSVAERYSQTFVRLTRVAIHFGFWFSKNKQLIFVVETPPLYNLVSTLSFCNCNPVGFFIYN
jgi:hypothetical protein